MISMLCFSVFGDDWRDEAMVWDEDKGEWVTVNKPRDEPQRKRDNRNDRANFNMGGNAWNGAAGTGWHRHLPRDVRLGKRQPTVWEVEKAQAVERAREFMRNKAQIEKRRREQLIKYRRATGWYTQRRNAGLQQGAGAYNMHMQNVRKYIYGY